MASKNFVWRVTKILIYLGLFAVTVAAAGVAVAYAKYGDELPSSAQVQAMQLEMPMRIYSRDGVFMGEFGAERRRPLTYQQIPQTLVHAFVAAEDDRFFHHPGIDYQGMIRAAMKAAEDRAASQGGSTITMQLARNMFLSSDRTFERKIKEILLSFKIENELSKEQIITLYLNKIYFGNRAYGVSTAAKTYFNKDVSKLNLSEMAVLAGLPKAPSQINPIANTERATERRDYVLRRMLELGYITEDAYNEALSLRVTPPKPQPKTRETTLEADYVTETVRKEVIAKYGEQKAYSSGFRVFTTLDSNLQVTANKALRRNLLNYDRRHGYRGAKTHVILPNNPTDKQLQDFLNNIPNTPEIVNGLVLMQTNEGLQVWMDRIGLRSIPDSALGWGGGAQRFEPGDVIELGVTQNGNWKLTQTPQVQGAFVAIEPKTGAVRALVGGYAYNLSKFNRATQALRQPGSSIKPFIYSAALENGYTAASIINDAPMKFKHWHPENYTNRHYGPTRLREALVYSRNLVSIRLLQGIGIEEGRQYLGRFGFPLERVSSDLTIALGTPTFTPLEVARGYTVFANGGYLTNPHFIDHIENMQGKTVFATKIACPNCAETPTTTPAPQVITPQNAWLMTDIMGDVIKRGTATRANSLRRSDIAGKTGTTNDQKDAWFSGISPHLVASSWLGFDQARSLGEGETGGEAALPTWIDFMEVALKNAPDNGWVRPEGLVTLRINPRNGRVAGAFTGKTIYETFLNDYQPGADKKAIARANANGVSPYKPKPKPKPKPTTSVASTSKSDSAQPRRYDPPERSEPRDPPVVAERPKKRYVVPKADDPGEANDSTAGDEMPVNPPAEKTQDVVQDLF